MTKGGEAVEVKGNGYGPGGRLPYSKSPSTAFNYDVIANTDDGYFLRYTLYVTFAMRRSCGAAWRDAARRRTTPGVASPSKVRAVYPVMAGWPAARVIALGCTPTIHRNKATPISNRQLRSTILLSSPTPSSPRYCIDTASR